MRGAATGERAMLAGAPKDRGWLARTTYPGRGLAIGWTADGAASVQLYWIMGRSSRSRNRRFVHDGAGAVRVVVAAAAGASGGDSSLILYRATAVARAAAPVAEETAAGATAARRAAGSAVHVIGNGDHTETIVEGLAAGDSFATAFARRDVEPDPPHYTPRIAGVVAAGGLGGYELAIIKTATGDPRQASFQHFTYRGPRLGWGHCITTYEGDGAPLPPFAGEPFLLPLAATPLQAVRELWELLDRDHRVAALAKFIDRATGTVSMEIINRHPAGGGPSGGAW
jgi:IMP cyclohydrolase